MTPRAPRRLGAALVAAAVLAVTPTPAAAQDGPDAACTDGVAGSDFCHTIAQGIESLLPVFVVAAEGGNPVPGTASTLGMRLTSMPRWTLGGRSTLGWAQSPNLLLRGDDENMTVLPMVFAFDGSIGILQGWNPLPTVGGVGSLDVLFGGSVAPLLSSDEYTGFGGWSWGAGARVGLLRESFTLPGVSISAMYRQLRDVSLGDTELEEADSYIETDLGVFSVRAAASKAIVLLNLTGGLGYDLIYGDVEFGYDDLLGAVRLTAQDARMQRLTIFGEVSYTLMVLNVILGGGWQEAPPEVEGAMDGDWNNAGSFYGTGSLRISI